MATRRRSLDDSVDQIREVGWAVVEDVLTPEELRTARAEAARLVPSLNEYESKSGAQGAFQNQNDPMLNYHATHAGGRLAPWQSHRLSGATPSLLGLCTQPWMLRLAASLLRDDPIVSSMELSAKYARGGDAFTQGFHIDPLYAVYPRASTPSYRFWVYLTDVTEESGPTELVALDDPNDLSPFRDPSPDFSGWYYPHEERAGHMRIHAATGSAGSMLIYQARAHHRGSGFKAATGCRWIAAFSFRARSWPWLGTSWDHPRTGAPVRPDFVRMSPDQRALLGFPPPGDRYWDEEGVFDEVERIFASIDLGPYRTRRRR